MRCAVILLTAACFHNSASHPLHQDEEIQSCSSLIYCQGEILDTVQNALIFPDSKTFVDMSLVNSVNETLDNFRKMKEAAGDKPTVDDIKRFVDDNFISQNETIAWIPPDFQSDPPILYKIADSNVKNFTKNLIGIWPTLGRKISQDVVDNPDKHSILEVPNGFVVPGGRFKELYYWDSYWIIKGLLLSEMHETVKGMLENFCHLINKFGFMPNGSRKYYLNRSQPPLFALMVQNYLKHTNDTDWLQNNIQCVEKELHYWLESHTVGVTKDGVAYELAHYESLSNTPRPESYDKDVKTCSIYSDKKSKMLCYKSLKSGAETGWDFSSRWFFDEQGGTATNLSHISAQRVVPVDLNTFLCMAFGALANFYNQLGNTPKMELWQEKSDIWKKSIEMVFYNETEGIWLDYDPILERHRNCFYPSNFAPLWGSTYDTSRRNYYGQNAADYFTRQNIDEFIGGVPTSLDETGEQWDFRNAWPPLQEIVVLGLWTTENEDAEEIAEKFADRWVSSNMKGYEDYQIMFEKYDALNPGQFGGGGEYVVQAGFGWTNGVALSFINEFFTDK